MKVTFSAIAQKEGSRRIEDDGWSLTSGLTFDVPPYADVVLKSTDKDTVRVTGTIKANVLSNCSRCGQDLSFKLEEEFYYIFTVGEDKHLQTKEVECSDEDSITIYLDEPEVDIGKVLEEQLILCTPGKLLCHKNCKGLCYQCGVKLSEGSCQCADGNTDSPFAILNKLKK